MIMHPPPPPPPPMMSRAVVHHYAPKPEVIHIEAPPIIVDHPAPPPVEKTIVREHVMVRHFVKPEVYAVEPAVEGVIVEKREPTLVHPIKLRQHPTVVHPIKFRQFPTIVHDIKVKQIDPTYENLINIPQVRGISVPQMGDTVVHETLLP